MSDPATVASAVALAQSVVLSAKPAVSGPAVSGETAIACTLSAGSMAARMREWQALLAHVEQREPIDGGVRSVFAASVPMAELLRLVVAEQECCEFFRFAITVDGRGVALEVRAPDDAGAILVSVFGAAS